MMQAGKLRWLVTIQSVSFQNNTFGEPIAAWEESQDVWASIDSLSGKELFSAQSVNALISHKVTTRYVDVKPQDRILFGSRVFNVEYVNHLDQRRITTVAYVKEVVQ